jgi:hypothetical protein
MPEILRTYDLHPDRTPAPSVLVISTISDYVIYGHTSTTATNPILQSETVNSEVHPSPSTGELVAMRSNQSPIAKATKTCNELQNTPQTTIGLRNDPVNKAQNPLTTHPAQSRVCLRSSRIRTRLATSSDESTINGQDHSP